MLFNEYRSQITSILVINPKIELRQRNTTATVSSHVTTLMGGTLQEMGGFTLRMKTPSLSSIPRKALAGTQSAISLLLCTNEL